MAQKDQFRPGPVTEADMDRWEEIAAMSEDHLMLGAFNWIYALRSLTKALREARQ